MEMRFARILAPLLLATVLGGCATRQVSGLATPSAQASTTLTQASALAQQNATLAGQARRENAREIERLLGGLDNATLRRDAAGIQANDPLYNFLGRALLRRGLDLPHGFDRSPWKLDARPAAESDGYRPPIKLAVLLPLSGDLATVAAPVRDGLMAGYYGETRRRPEVLFFDTAGTAGGAIAAYGRAVAAGADFVVGPLGRDEVSALFQDSRLSVPALVLNRDNADPPAGHAGFSLAPEDDGLTAVEYLLAREHRNVLVISGSDDNGRRAAQSFGNHFTERGGKVVAVVSVGDSPGDQSAALASAAAAGADAVFLAVKGSVARQLTPQLALAGLGGKTRVGTSQLLSGTGKLRDDVALDGIVFPTEVWTSRGFAGLPSPGLTGERLVTARGPAARLFAFGYDAWLLTAYLDRLLNGKNAELRGATGRLQLDGFGNVLRTPAWSTFRGGLAVPVNEGG